MLGVLAILTGLWAEYRNRAGYKAGVSQGMMSLLWALKQQDIIEIDAVGKISPKFKKEIVDVR
jgi:hypothetical protein